MKQQIIVIGAGGHAKSLIELVESTSQFQIKGLIGMANEIGKKVLNYEVFDSDENINRYISSSSFALGIGQIKSSAFRFTIFNKIKELGGSFPVLVSSSSVVSNHAKIEEGTTIFHQTLINSGAKIGKCSIINSGAIVEHDASIGDFCHISTNATINGNCTLGNAVFIGSGSTLIQETKITSNCVIGAGSLVTKNILEEGIHFGSPIK